MTKEKDILLGIIFLEIRYPKTYCIPPSDNTVTPKEIFAFHDFSMALKIWLKQSRKREKIDNRWLRCKRKSREDRFNTTSEGWYGEWKIGVSVPDSVDRERQIEKQGKFSRSKILVLVSMIYLELEIKDYWIISWCSLTQSIDDIRTIMMNIEWIHGISGNIITMRRNVSISWYRKDDFDNQLFLKRND